MEDRSSCRGGGRSKDMREEPVKYLKTGVVQEAAPQGSSTSPVEPAGRDLLEDMRGIAH